MVDVGTESGWDRRRRLLVTEYERVALDLFADRGFRDVTVEDIAEKAGVSARTLYRYFPTKEDFLLGLPRRAVGAYVEMIAALDPAGRPAETAWSALQQFSSESVPDVELLTLWRKAAADAPEVVARVRGERVQGLLDSLTEYFAVSLGADPATDVRPRLLAGVLAGAELALIETLSRSELTAREVFGAVEQSIRLLGN